MTPYPDGGFLLTLLIRTGGTYIARKVLAEVERELMVNPLHQLQAENLLRQMEMSPDPELRRSARTGKRLLGWYTDEGFFSMQEINWGGAFNLALSWNSGWKDVPPPPLLLLHPALAVASGATHFLSFDPRARVVARRAELKLLPARL